MYLKLKSYQSEIIIRITCSFEINDEFCQSTEKRRFISVFHLKVTMRPSIRSKPALTSPQVEDSSKHLGKHVTM